MIDQNLHRGQIDWANKVLRLFVIVKENKQFTERVDSEALLFLAIIEWMLFSIPTTIS